MKIYFVRHGETEYNRRVIHQHLSVPLDERGREQARQTGEELKKLGISRLVTSDLVRAKETADIIGSITRHQPALHPLFREVKRPSELYGKSHYHPMSLWIGAQMLLHLHNREWHYSDEENLYDIKHRVGEAVHYLRELAEKHEKVAIVSHAFILNMFIKYMCGSGEVHVGDYLKTLFAAKRLDNGSISTLEFNDDGNPNTCDWICTDLNNTNHLTER